MSKNNPKNQLEIELASSILYYDKSEMTRFFDIYDSISSDINIVIDGLFDTFVSYIKKFKNFDGTSEERRNRLIEEIKIRNNQVTSSHKRENFELWFEKVLDTETPMELADDILDHFIWVEFKQAINKVDGMDIPFKDKIAIRPKVPKSLNQGGLIRLEDIEEDDDDNKISYTSGLEDLDKIVSFEPTNFVVIAARPGVGKSLFMLQQAIACARQGVKTLFLSFEMNDKQIHNRIISHIVGENLQEQHKDEYGVLNKESYKKALQSVKSTNDYKRINQNLCIYVSEESSADSILAKIEDQIKESKFEAIFLDYLQLLRYNRLDEWASLRTLTNALKNMAFRNKVLIVTGSQVSRNSTEHGLYLSDLFGSSSIEADTDIVIGLENLRDRKQGEKALINVKVLKNREGDIGELKYVVDYSACRLTYNE